jgi:hypothetical protein
MIHTIAYYQSVDQAGAYVALNGVADPRVRVVGADIQVPALNKVIAAAVGIEVAAANRARLVAPSLRELASFQLAPTNSATAAAVLPVSPPSIIDLRANPLALISGEQLNAELLANPVAAQIQWCVVWLADVPPAPVTGRMFTVRATSATALVAGTWSNVALTFDEDLPRGRYAVVGLCPVSAGMIAARLNFVGGGYAPGCMGFATSRTAPHPMFRYGGLGVLGEFEDIEPPTIDGLSASADATQEYFLDLIQLSKATA